MNLNVTYQFNSLVYTDFLVANNGNADVTVDRHVDASHLAAGTSYNSDSGAPNATFAATAKNTDGDDVILFKSSAGNAGVGYLTESLALHPGGGALCAAPGVLFVNGSN